MFVTRQPRKKTVGLRPVVIDLERLTTAELDELTKAIAAEARRRAAQRCRDDRAAFKECGPVAGGREGSS
jgi:hypothetical protein